MLKYLMISLMFLIGCNPFMKARYSMGDKVQLTGFYEGCSGTVINFRVGMCFNGQYTVEEIRCNNGARTSIDWICSGDVK